METNQRIVFPARKKAELLKEEFTLEPDRGELIGRTLISVVSSGSECGNYMNYLGGSVYPSPTGYAGVMEVLKVGADISDIKVGDVVFAQTPHQLLNCVRRDEVVLVPKSMNPEHAVLCRFPAISMTTMIQTQIRPTEPILVAGLGIVGLTCAQMMKHCGYDVYAVDPVASRREIAERCGIAHVYEAANDSVPHYGAFGLAIDCTGSDAAVFAVANGVRKGGELSLVGVPWRQTSDHTMRDFMSVIFYRFLKVYSGWEWSLPLHSGEFKPNSNFHSFAKAMEWIRDGALSLGGIYALYDPADCQEVYDAIADNHLPTTCALFDWRTYITDGKDGKLV